MRDYSLTHLDDAELLRELANWTGRDRLATAVLLAYIAEVDLRRLYVPAGYPSMFAFCVGDLRMSDDVAGKRIHAARVARRFPQIFAAIADGRLHLAAVCLVAPYLTSDNAAEWIQAAMNKRKHEIESLLSRRFPLQTVPAPVVRAVAVAPMPHGRAESKSEEGDGTGSGASPTLFDTHLHAPEPSGSERSDSLTLSTGEHAPGHAHMPLLSPVESATSAVGPAVDLLPPPVKSDAPSNAPAPAERFLIKVTVEKSTHEKFCRAQVLLSHSVRSGDVAELLDRSFEALIEKLEKRRLGVVRPSRQAAPLQEGNRRIRTKGSRHIPARIRRAVWERDEGRCTFVGAKENRCEARRHLEFDHVVPVALGGVASIGGLRLRCRAHNQFEAERTFGREFMEDRRNKGRGPADQGVGISEKSE